MCVCVLPDVILGFQSSSLVSVREDVGDVEVCVGVFNPAPDEVLNTTLTLIIETAPGTAGGQQGVWSVF